MTASLGCGAVEPLFEADGGEGGIKHEAIAAAVDHVLKNDHSVLVAVVVKERMLDLDMLSKHIESELFHLQNVVFKTLGGGGGIDSVAEVALVEKSVEEIGLAV